MAKVRIGSCKKCGNCCQGKFLMQSIIEENDQELIQKLKDMGEHLNVQFDKAS